MTNVVDVAYDDTTGDVWVATRQNLFSWDGIALALVSATNRIRHIAADGTGRVWAATNDSLLLFDGAGSAVLDLP